MVNVSWPVRYEVIVVLERMKESLSVLKHQLCMEWEDIIPFYVPLFVIFELVFLA